MNKHSPSIFWSLVSFEERREKILSVSRSQSMSSCRLASTTLKQRGTSENVSSRERIRFWNCVGNTAEPWKFFFPVSSMRCVINNKYTKAFKFFGDWMEHREECSYSQPATINLSWQLCLRHSYMNLRTHAGMKKETELNSRGFWSFSTQRGCFPDSQLEPEVSV